jgi:hypothetical protein
LWYDKFRDEQCSQGAWEAFIEIVTAEEIFDRMALLAPLWIYADATKHTEFFSTYTI